MIELRNDTLAAHVLDPLEDRGRLGPRFTTGGYVYQVRDVRTGNILSGPEYPEAYPSVINGQGLPEVFQFTLYEHEEEIPEKKLIIGVGLVDNRAGFRAAETHFTSPVGQFCRWEEETGPGRVDMETAQHYGPWSLSLRKEVLLEGRSLTLSTRLRNRGERPLPYRWFAHPFFPLTSDGRCSRFPAGLTLPENPGFLLGPDGVLTMRTAADWRHGVFVLAGVDNLRDHLSVVQFHSAIEAIDVRCSFIPSRLALWANDRTYSFEPFTQGTLEPGAGAEWQIVYTFGEGA